MALHATNRLPFWGGREEGGRGAGGGLPSFDPKSTFFPPEETSVFFCHYGTEFFFGFFFHGGECSPTLECSKTCTLFFPLSPHPPLSPPPPCLLGYKGERTFQSPIREICAPLPLPLPLSLKDGPLFPFPEKR